MSSLAMTVAMTGLTIGFMLYYIIPLMPFVYFFFAVAGWVKAIFEAMVGVPLWALAHIRIDGDGLPGPGGMNGYFLFFEILVRPSLIVFGLIASVSVLAASVYVLNDIFDLAIVNLTGHGSPEAADATELEFYRNAIDQFFYTILYAISVYMLALSCFKLIDLVPDQIMRWLGTNISAFGDAEKESAGNLVSMAYSGTMLTGNQIQSSGALGQGALAAQFFTE
jgi:conjugal transfer/type IV secretion protein DotA/TraY